MISNNKNRVNEFSPHLVAELTALIDEAATNKSEPLIAAFDADGTLWDTDIGEAFFDYQIGHCGLTDMPSDPWHHYLELKKQDPPTAYAWLAQINAGKSLKQVRAWAAESLQRQLVPVFSSQKRLITLLLERGFEVFIVTASVKWAVEPAAALVGVDFDHVLGITTEIKNGLVTQQPVEPITWRQGKADALLRATAGIRPILCAGNTFGDIALLETATKMALAVSTQTEEGSGLFIEESKLREEADRRGWRQHFFRNP